jgi:hypothetical protein
MRDIATHNLSDFITPPSVVRLTIAAHLRRPSPYDSNCASRGTGRRRVQPVLDSKALRSGPAARESILDGIRTLSTENATIFDRQYSTCQR